MRKIITSIIITAVVAGGIGFFAGMEYKVYEIKSAFESAFKVTPTPSSDNSTPGQTQIASNGSASIINQAKQEGDKIITKKITDEVTLATLKFQINKVTETQTLSGGYGNPKVAPTGSKYVLLNMTVTNTTNTAFNLDPSSGFVIVDSKQREFNPQSAIGDLTDYLDQRTLQSSIPETGTLVYLLPADATSYSFNILKGGTKELYQIPLK